MRVCGDHARWEDPAEKLGRIRRGGSSHAELVDRLCRLALERREQARAHSY